MLDGHGEVFSLCITFCDGLTWDTACCGGGVELCYY